MYLGQILLKQSIPVMFLKSLFFWLTIPLCPSSSKGSSIKKFFGHLSGRDRFEVLKGVSDLKAF